MVTFSIVFIFVFIIVTVIVIPLRERYKYQQLPTFTEYVTKLPQYFKNNTILCYKCGSKFTYLRIIHKTFTKLFRVNTCKQCGQILYRVD